MTEQQKVEFINGQVVLHLPVKIRHLDAVSRLSRVLSVHVDWKNLGWVGSEKNLVCLTRNDYEPDVVFYGPAKAVRLQPDQMKLPAPDFVAEVLSPSTESNDRGVKLQDYAAHGILEYWIVDPVAEAVEQYVLPEGSETDMAVSYRAPGRWTGDDKIVSVAVPGFVLPARALFEREANLVALAALTV